MRLVYITTFLILFVLSGIVSAQNQISECTVIDQPGYYVLTNDLLYNGSDSCIQITSSDVIFNGGGHIIEGGISEGSSDGAGIQVYNQTSTISNVTIKNVTVKGLGYGISFDESENGSIFNTNVTQNMGGVIIEDSANITVSNSNISYNLFGTGVLESTEISILDNLVSMNIFGGIFLSESQNNTISGNNIINNSVILNDFYGEPESSIVDGNEEIFLFSGVIFISSDYNTVNDNDISSNKGSGLTLIDSSDNQIKGNTIDDNRVFGLGFFESPENLIYNNHFNNTENVYFYRPYIAFINIGPSDGQETQNIWNISKTRGKNIVGGPYLGGNYWAKPDGTGFSQTCNDTDKDGICDIPFEINEWSMDYLPLTNPPPVKPKRPHALSFSIPNSYFRAEQIGLRMRVPVNESAEFGIWIKNYDDQPVTIQIYHRLDPATPGSVDVELPSVITLQPMEERTVEVNITPYNVGSFIVHVTVESPDVQYISYDFVFVVDAFES